MNGVAVDDENIIPRNMIINLGCASVDNHIPRDDIFDYHPKLGNVIFMYQFTASFFCQIGVMWSAMRRSRG